jgi:outer membrane protein, multidrug efflux system
MNRLNKGAAWLAPGVLLAGCTMAPHDTRPAMPVPATQPAQAGAAAADTSPPLAWQAFFTDARLGKVIAIALANNRDLRLAIAHVAQARAQARVQGGELFPTISAGAAGDMERVPSGLSTYGASRYDLARAQVGVSAWEVDLFGRLRSLTRAAQEQYFASADNRRAAQVTLIAEVADGWLQLAGDQEQLAIAQQTEQAYAQTLAITRGRAGQGVASDLDARQAEAAWQQARADVARLATSVAQDRNAIDLLAGTPVAQDLLPTGQEGLEPTIAGLPGGLASSVLLARPDVSAAEHQLKAANADIGAARAAFFPNVSLTAAFGTLSLGLSNLFGSGSQAWSVQPSATIPIFDAGRNLGNLRYAQATRDAMLASYEKAIQTAFREVADALARRATIGDQLDAQARRTAAARQALIIAQARYSQGIDPFLTTLDSERALYTARGDLAASRLERQTNAVELFRALGGGGMTARP